MSWDVALWSGLIVLGLIGAQMTEPQGGEDGRRLGDGGNDRGGV